ncbi:MAG: ComEC/Rec2 family competence protein [Saprospiraceae bacterium]|nr:ComEC family competence protein [Lewinellaceae bacterium]
MPWAIGIITGAWLNRPVPGLNLALVLCGIALLVLIRRKYAYRYRWVFGVLLTITLLGAGYRHMVAHDERQQPDHYSRICPQADVFYGTVYDTPTKGATLKVPLRLQAAGRSTDTLNTCSGNVLLFMEITPKSERLRYGDQIWVHAPIRPVQPLKNPHAFDYRRYLHFQNIHYQAFVKASSFEVRATGYGQPQWRAAFRWRDQLLEMLRNHFPSRDEYAVASALLLGYKEDLSDELRASYADTGSMHALAVSGMHVGLLYIALLFVLNRIPWRGPARRWAETGFVLSGIWMFTFVTGATPSVLRASVMFTAFILGKAIRRQASVWNILGASAFLLLLFNPYLLFEAGFQLSYSAVAGIVFFYPQFQKLTPPLPKWAVEGWKILLIGVAAQLGTLPLSLYYFHQFPVYFWLAGWVVVLGGAVFLWGGFLLILLHGLSPELSDGLGWCLFQLIRGMNMTIQTIQQLPGSVLNGIWLEAWSAVFLTMLIWLLPRAIAVKKPKLMLAALGVLVLLSSTYAIKKFGQLRQKKLIVYHTSRYFLLDSFVGEKRFSWTDSLSQRQEQFAAQTHRWACGIRESAVLTHGFTNPSLFWQPPFLQFFEKKLAVVGRQIKANDRAGPPVNVDVVILHGNPNINIDDCLRQFPCDLVVFAASNTRRRVERWKADCQVKDLAFYDVGENGAWELVFP